MGVSSATRDSGFIRGLLLFCFTILIFVLGGCQMAEKERSEIAVGFEKGVSQEKAENILSKYKLEFEKRDNLNMGKVFFYETGEKYLIKVPKGAESKWIDKLNEEETIKKVGIHRDRSEGFFID